MYNFARRSTHGTMPTNYLCMAKIYLSYLFRRMSPFDLGIEQLQPVLSGLFVCSLNLQPLLSRCASTPLIESVRTALRHFVTLCIESLVLRNEGNTPLHLAMDSAHAEAAVLLINAGADRTRVRIPIILYCGVAPFTCVIMNFLFDRRTWKARLRRACQGWEVSSNDWPDNMS